MAVTMRKCGRHGWDTGGCSTARTVKPSGYPIPVNRALAHSRAASPQPAARAHPFHIHQARCNSQYLQLYLVDDPNLETDMRSG
jgi:hypothetical protein